MQSETPPQRLWIEPLQGRFFLVPTSAAWPQGTALVFALDAQTLEPVGVDVAALTAWETTEADARARWLAALEVGAAVLPQVGAQSNAALAALVPGLGPAVALLERGSTDGPEVLTTLFGLDPNALEQAPEQVERAVASLRALAKDTEASPTPPAPQTPEAEALVALVARWSFEALETPPEASRPVTSQTELVDLLRLALTGLKRLGPGPAETRAQQARRIQDDARRAVDAATEGWAPPTYDFDTLLRD